MVYAGVDRPSLQNSSVVPVRPPPDPSRPAHAAAFRSAAPCRTAVPDPRFSRSKADWLLLY